MISHSKNLFAKNNRALLASVEELYVGSLSYTELMSRLVRKGPVFRRGGLGGGTSPQEPPVLTPVLLSDKNCRSPLRAGKSLTLSSIMGRY